MKLAIGCDHAGYELKNEIIQYLKNFDGVEVEDHGTYSGDSVDYPDLALKVAEAVAFGDAERGIVICGTGIGISIAANKVPGIRAANCHDQYTAQMCREHNNANILAFGSRVITAQTAKELVKTFLETDFAGGRHQRRVDKITGIEQKYSK
ncbi:ribose 5-phosphate isomerase B [Desulfohalotomaculum tongense]|uniref:ribose 5-phosphate isomerase B n=1 Tax=Desulforadius tongensis TaxID=1216062 RepID=UPI00195806B7|nr:ribose 5-phosphate isomerase B [Desulforadius tongensis]MBM7853743.1 ribose 5-phosphate isomerase B [Desulforadius tongensis]